MSILRDVALVLVPTERTSSLGAPIKQLSYVWKGSGPRQAWDLVSILPPVVSRGGMIQLVIKHDNSEFGGIKAIDVSSTDAPRLTISGDFPVPGIESEPFELGTGRFEGAWTWSRRLEEGGRGFRFRVVLTGVNGDAATIYTVDPEVVVGDGDDGDPDTSRHR